MNKIRRKQLAEAVAKIEAVIADLETVRDDEQEAMDGLPDNFRDGAQGDAMQEVIDAIEDAINSAGDARDWLTGITTA